MLTARREESDILKVSTKLSRCKIVKMQARSCWSRSGWTDKSVDPAHKKIRSRLWQGIQDEEARHDSKSLSCFSVVLSNATTEAVKALVSIMMSVSWSNKGRPLKLRHHHISRAPFKRSPETHLHPTSSTRPSETWRRQSWQINQENVWNSRRGPTTGNLTT